MAFLNRHGKTADRVSFWPETHAFAEVVHTCLSKSLRLAPKFGEPALLCTRTLFASPPLLLQPLCFSNRVQTDHELVQPVFEQPADMGGDCLQAIVPYFGVEFRPISGWAGAY
ncbi:hypothetical protein SADO_14634 [Salinisphaera dokdonensis CL-ES53]|uniref:Uncharacterized protein n=1 Tax=Salinisphaera dokdonensis CL-ES53 TaxID=1304272 RepID=A0ABV2B4F0_9GAMM